MHKNNLIQELKNYHQHKKILKNDEPWKFYLFNVYFFIHLFFWVFLIWQGWSIISILVPTNNSVITSHNNIMIVFETSFNYVYKTFNNSSTSSNWLSDVNWFFDTKIFIGLAIVVFLLTIYLYILLKNFLLDLDYIFTKNDHKKLIQTNENCRFLLKQLFLFIGFNVIWTTFSLIFVYHKSINNSGYATIKTLLFAPSTNSSKSYTLPLTGIGYITLILNIAIMFATICFYWKYCYEIFLCNHFLYKDCRSKLMVKENKKSQKFNKKISINFAFWKKKISMF